MKPGASGGSVANTRSYRSADKYRWPLLCTATNGQLNVTVDHLSLERKILPRKHGPEKRPPVFRCVTLPAIPVPLKPPDADVTVELQRVFAEAFTRGRYERRLQYGAPPRARLSRADREWATQLAVAARRENK